MSLTQSASLPNRVAFETRYVPHPLDAALPIACSLWSLSDEPISVLDRHDVLELGLCIEGTGTYLVEDKMMPYKAGSLAIVNDTECHFSQSAPGTSSRWLTMFLRPESLVTGIDRHRSVLSTRELAGRSFQNVIHEATYPEIVGLARTLFHEAVGQRAGKEAAIKGLAWAVMANLQRLPGRSLEAASKLDALTSVAPALERIKTGFAEPVDLNGLATLCEMSLRTFTRHFQMAVDDAPMRFLNRFRIAQACELLANSRTSVLDVSLDVGFNSLAAFNRHFRAFTGKTPREWRREPMVRPPSPSEPSPVTV
jgi:AraC-like DNA-binding protein